MSQHIALPGVLTNKTSRSAPLDVIQPACALIQTTSRPAELDPPKVNGILVKTDMILPICIGEMLN